MEVIFMADRIVRISEEVKKEISSIIQNDLKDPRLPNMVSIISCSVTKDLRYAKVFISVLGNDEEKKNAISALKSAAGFIRRELGHRIQLRYTPEIHFELDTSIEHGIYINKLLDDAKKELTD
jgi:ribosome-binding factor A